MKDDAEVSGEKGKSKIQLKNQKLFKGYDFFPDETKNEKTVFQMRIDIT